MKRMKDNHMSRVARFVPFKVKNATRRPPTSTPTVTVYQNPLRLLCRARLALD